jgi:hypothetical protein
VKKIAQAFLEFAKRSPDFADKATEVISHKPEEVDVAETANASR